MGSPKAPRIQTCEEEGLEGDSARQLHDALSGRRGWRAECAQRGQDLGCAVVRVERVVDIADVVTVRDVEGLGDELQLRSSEHRNVPSDAGIDRELRREPK